MKTSAHSTKVQLLPRPSKARPSKARPCARSSPARPTQQCRPAMRRQQPGRSENRVDATPPPRQPSKFGHITASSHKCPVHDTSRHARIPRARPFARPRAHTHPPLLQTSSVPLTLTPAPPQHPVCHRLTRQQTPPRTPTPAPQCRPRASSSRTSSQSRPT